MVGVEKVGGDSSETGLVMKKGKKIDDRYQRQPHPGLQGKGESNNNII